MMTFDELKEELHRYTYRSDWLLSMFWDEHHSNTMLYVVAQVEDAYNAGNKIPLRIKVWVPPMDTPEDFARWLFWRLKEMEIHECMEMFRLRETNRPVFDPHAEEDPPMDQVILQQPR
jgi:hypothetical protein